ncbi:MAG: NAD(P)(+) transhydrogenase (Re/Si-specific) subunit beta [Myxococcales bacterium]|nr:NAD(P)(+) transhydrogenase (Re/Si-specific) subunit beta [Myxococcales bacterium]
MGASYLIASVCFILTLQALSSPRHARKGVLLGCIGMALAVAGTLLHPDIKVYTWLALAALVGAVIGAAMSIWIPMTKMPERIALSHSFGGLAAALVGVSEYLHLGDSLGGFKMGAVGLEVYFGFLTFTGSLMAFGKLQGFISGAPLTYKGQNLTNLGSFFGALGLLVLLIVQPETAWAFYAMCATGFALGILFVLPIGGADMPVVVSLLNSYAGLAAAATGFALDNNVLIIAGSLDCASGFLLSLMMSKAMNRSFANVLFGAFGTGDASPTAMTAAPAANVHQATMEEVVDVLQSSQSVIVVPGYGMAVSQAQHALRDLATQLEKQGATVKYAIHPVAGRMPGHMNVLLAEANVPYDQLFDLDEINDEFARTDVALIVGANDIVNPAAKTNPQSPIFGMPVFDVDKARTVMVLKRSFNPGFSGIDNDLFALPNTMMVLGDARKTLVAMGNGIKT